MRTLFVSPYLHPEGGGLEHYAARVAEEVAREGHDVTMLGHAAERIDEVRSLVRRVGVPVAVRLSNTPLHPALYREARALLRAAPHDVVNAHTPVPGAAEMAWLAASRERVPFVVTYHAGALRAGTRLFDAPAWLHARTVERAMLSRAAARIAVSPFVAGSVSPDLEWRLAPPGVDGARFRPTHAPVPGRILFVGPVARAYSWKGLDVLFDAFARLAPDRPEAHLRVVGEGDLRATYERRARTAGLDARFTIVGRVDDDALVREYSRASVVVLPSRTDAESFGMVLAEANACARPVVASRVGGIPSFVRDGRNGLLVPPGDVDALGDAISRVLGEPMLAWRLGDEGRRIVLAEHRWEDVAKRALAAFEAASATRSASVSAASARAPRRTAP